ncbi:MAG: glycoside hydrolase family 3 C-terminal domain-containing protein [Clostridia bacterium]|nr:glycoside hydrolase family 3 C-terminal domain-containing protein [Clostridia bacterium]
MATKLTDHASVEKILQEMTIAEKARMVIGGSPFHTEAMPEYGIPAMFMIDSCNGLNSMEYLGEKVYAKLAAEAEAAGTPLDREKNSYMGGLLIALGALKKMAAGAGSKSSPKPFGCYPPGIAQGSTWNPEVIEACGRELAREMSSYGIDMILGPNVNIHRDPLCGRLGESYTEDPFLMSKLGPALIKGIQGEGIIACAKHFAANNQEKDRMGVEEHVPERALREIYFPGFKACVDAGCRTLMSAYNKLNGMPSAMNKWLLTDVLRKEWDFEGFVVSDWGASYDQVLSVAAGTDLTMPGPRGIKCIEEAVANGSLRMEKLDECVRNVLHVIVDSTAMTGRRHALNRAASLEAMENVLREGMILLKNDGTLPLKQDVHVAFYGKRSRKMTICPAGSSNVETDLATNPYDRAAELLGAEKLTFGESNENTKFWIAVVGADGREGADREHLMMDEDDKQALEQAISEANAAGGKVVLVINATGPIDLNDYEDRVSAILCPFLPGIQGGKITADAIFGLFNPSGKLALTWPKNQYDCPAYKNFGGENKEVWYGEGIYVGYRWYDARRIEPAYPFGYGLSYTSFEITDVQVPAEINVERENIPVSIRVKNTGSMAGSEVVQVYVRDVECRFDRPEKELKGFRKVFLQPGEEKTVAIEITKADLAGYYMDFGEWITQPGEFDILVGTSSRDIAFTRRVDVRCRDPFGWNGRASIGKIAANAKSVEIINRIIEDDITILCHVALDFAPDKSLQELWSGTNIQDVLHSKGWDDATIEAKYRQIMDEFDAL